MIVNVLFYVFGAILVATALGVITARNPVHCALFLVAAFLNSAVIWLLLEAEFLAVTLIVVYVGAVMVLWPVRRHDDGHRPRAECSRVSRAMRRWALIALIVVAQIGTSWCMCGTWGSISAVPIAKLLVLEHLELGKLALHAVPVPVRGGGP